jgi:hypothetical protein
MKGGHLIAFLFAVKFLFISVWIKKNVRSICNDCGKCQDSLFIFLLVALIIIGLLNPFENKFSVVRLIRQMSL